MKPFLFSLSNLVKSMTIKKRFTFSVLVVVIFMMSLLGIVRIKDTGENINNEMEKKSTVTTELIALSFSDSLWNYNDEGMKVIGDALFKDPEICLVVVKNNQGRDIYQKNTENQMYEKKDLILVEKQILKNNMILGTVTLGFTTYQNKLTLRKEIITTIISISLTVLILWLLISVISNMITKPIYELSEGTEEITRGNLTKRLQIKSDDEIGGLARKFNTMTENMYNVMKELEQKNESLEIEIKNKKDIQEALHHAHANLEIKVEERTQELFAMNQELIAMNQIFQIEIAERKRTEKELEQKNQELKQAYGELENAQSQVIQQEKMASIGQLAAGVAHEINNPIGFIISNLDSLRGYMGKIAKFLKIQEELVEELTKVCEELSVIEKIASFFSKIKETKKTLKIDYIIHDTEDLLDETLDGARRVKDIVQGLKGFARMTNESMLANINEGIESTIHIIWNELKYKATLIKDFGEIPLTKCNPGQLNQVFMNLLVNASQAIEVKGDIHVKTWAEEENIFASIRDTGSGIPSEILTKIFDPFYTTKEVGKGTGLGLSISYDIVKKHGGEIKVQSEVGQGTIFTIRIPVVEE